MCGAAIWGNGADSNHVDSMEKHSYDPSEADLFTNMARSLGRRPGEHVMPALGVFLPYPAHPAYPASVLTAAQLLQGLLGLLGLGQGLDAIAHHERKLSHLLHCTTPAHEGNEEGPLVQSHDQRKWVRQALM